jgi:phytoene dehydrogenase-like protein
VKRAETICVVGGGLAGLTAASFAARSGASVELLESVSSPGGRARTRAEKGFLLNMGPHALYVAGPGGGVLRELGVRPDGASPPQSGSLARHAGRYCALPAGIVSLLTTGLLGAAEKLEVGRLLAMLPRLDASAYDAQPLADAIVRLARHPRSRLLLEALVRLTSYSHDPARMSAGAALRQIQHALDGGVIYLHGGWQSLVEALASRARAAGVRIRNGARALAVEPRDDAFAVRTADGEITAGAVVLCTPPEEARRLLSGSDALASAVRGLVPVRAASLDVALSSLPSAKRRFALGIDEPTYFAIHSDVARLAPNGGAVIHATRYLAPGEEPDRAATLAMLEERLDELQPGWRERVAVRRFLPNLCVSHALPLASAGGLAGRPGAGVAEIPGLLVAGDWVGPEGLLADASLASGRRAGLLAAGARGLSVAA